MAAKTELGTKRICPDTGREKLYDLGKSPVISPYTGKVVPIEIKKPRSSRARGRKPHVPPPCRRDRNARAGGRRTQNSSRSRTPKPNGGGRQEEKRQDATGNDLSEDDEEIEGDDESLDDAGLHRRTGRRRSGRYRHHRRRDRKGRRRTVIFFDLRLCFFKKSYTNY